MSINVVPTKCVICDDHVARPGRGAWQCPDRSSDCWRWRDDRRNAVKRPPPTHRETPRTQAIGFQGTRKTIYELAKDAVAARSTGFPQECLTIFENCKLRVYISRYQQLLLMDAVNGDPKQAERVRIGYLSPYQGWVFNLSQTDYRQWAARAKKLVETEGE